jgi:SAM-dependent methyltransferase
MSGPRGPRRIAGGLARRVPLRPLRVLLPYALWRPLFRLWLAVLRADPDRARAVRRLLEVHGDAWYAMDRASIAYDGGIHPKHRLTRYHDFFVERVRPGERVLDVGCGKGELAHDLAERAEADVVAIDTSRWALDFARSRSAHPRVSYVEADATGYVPEQPVDVAVLSNVLEHIAPRVALLRSLREDAGARRLLIRVPQLERDWIVPLRRELGLPYFSDRTHELEYSPEALAAELAEAGWRMGEPALVWGEIWVEAERG